MEGCNDWKKAYARETSSYNFNVIEQLLIIYNLIYSL